MKVVYIDSKSTRWENFKDFIEKFEEINNCICYGDCEKLQLDYVDIVFIYISAECDNTKELFEKVKDVNQLAEIVFITDCKEYKVKAFEMDVLGYIATPISDECIKNIISKVQKLHNTSENKPTIRTFGNFDIFIEDKAIMFSNKKAKELLALLVDKGGGSLNMEQIIDVLWEDRPFDENTKALYRIALKNLRDTLKKAGCIEILREKRGQRSIDVNKVFCDFYELVNGKQTNFSGEYMTNYSWGEYTLAKLFEKYC